MNESMNQNDEDAGICADCGYPLTPVRPGKAQCDYCELLEVYERESYDHIQTRKALDALIAENDKLQATIAQLQDRLDNELAEWKTCADTLYSAAEIGLEYGPSAYADDCYKAVKLYDEVKKFYAAKE